MSLEACQAELTRFDEDGRACVMFEMSPDSFRRCMEQVQYPHGPGPAFPDADEIINTIPEGRAGFLRDPRDGTHSSYRLLGCEIYLDRVLEGERVEGFGQQVRDRRWRLETVPQHYQMTNMRAGQLVDSDGRMIGNIVPTSFRLEPVENFDPYEIRAAQHWFDDLRTADPVVTRNLPSFRIHEVSLMTSDQSGYQWGAGTEVDDAGFPMTDTIDGSRIATGTLRPAVHAQDPVVDVVQSGTYTFDLTPEQIEALGRIRPVEGNRVNYTLGVSDPQRTVTGTISHRGRRRSVVIPIPQELLDDQIYPIGPQVDHNANVLAEIRERTREVLEHHVGEQATPERLEEVQRELTRNLFLYGSTSVRIDSYDPETGTIRASVGIQRPETTQQVELSIYDEVVAADEPAAPSVPICIAQRDFSHFFEV